MNNVQVIELKPMKMLSFYAYGEHPEYAAWEKLQNWVKENNFKIIPGENKIFGFNNPCPSAGSVNYGYEFWLSVSEDIKPEGDVRLVDFYGGLYAVSHIQIKSGEEIPEHWKELLKWCENSQYEIARLVWLEEHSTEGIPTAIYLPIS